MYKPALVIVPTVELPPATLLTLQLTAVFAVPVTVAVSCSVFPKTTLELEDDTDTVTDCGGGLFGVEEPPPHPLAPINIAAKKLCLSEAAYRGRLSC